MFEVEDLRSATLATVSRCGMVWFSEEVLTFDMICENFLTRLRKIPMDESEGLTMGTPLSTSLSNARQSTSETVLSPTLQVREKYVFFIRIIYNLTCYYYRYRMTVLISYCHSLPLMDWWIKRYNMPNSTWNM